MTSPDKIVQTELLPFIRMYQSGRVERLTKAKDVPASIDPRTRVNSRDITINPFTLLNARLYLPPPPIISCMTGQRKLPIVVYYHGGAFCTLSPSSRPHHTYLNSLVSMANVVGISVGYRLAPEHPLPAAYDDSWEALLWVMKQSEKCITEVGDLSRLFLAGESSGANIVHNMGMRLQENGMQVEGMAMVQPYFWGKERKEGTVNKDTSTYTFGVECADAMWPFVCPSSAGLDDPWLNPMSKEAGLSLARLGCRRIIVTVTEHDVLREWGISYYEKLKEDGWGNELLEFFETKGEKHAFHIFQPSKKTAAELMQRLVRFFTYDTKKMGKL